MKICVGIISYFPDDERRKVRINRFRSLISQLNNHFKLPVIIVAQNWKDFRVEEGNIAVFSYDKLGITRARSTLRKHFINSTYDYMIMLDDDMELSDNQVDYDLYLRAIESNKKEYYYVRNYLNNFSCISKQGIQKVDYDLSIDPEQGTGFEDWIFHTKCKKILDSMELDTALPAHDRTYFLNDQFSTWNTGNEKLSKSNNAVSLGIIRKLRGNDFDSGRNWF